MLVDRLESIARLKDVVSMQRSASLQDRTINVQCALGKGGPYSDSPAKVLDNDFSIRSGGTDEPVPFISPVHMRLRVSFAGVREEPNCSRLGVETDDRKTHGLIGSVREQRRNEDVSTVLLNRFRQHVSS